MELIIRICKNAFRIYYDNWLGAPYHLLKNLLGEENTSAWLEPVFKLAVTLIFLLILREIYLRMVLVLNRRRIEKTMEGHDVREPHTVRDSSFVQELDMAQHPVHTLSELMKEKQYGRMGDIYAKLNQPEEAARWLIKDGQYQKAAAELAKAGKTLKAARILLRTGDFQTAARFYSLTGKHKRAAAALIKGGDLPGAACAYAEGRLYSKSAECFEKYFSSTSDSVAAQVAGAEKCYHLLQKNDFAGGLKTDRRNDLFKMAAMRFLAAGRAALAASLFQEAGDTKRASEIFKQLGEAQAKEVKDIPPAPRRN